MVIKHVQIKNHSLFYFSLFLLGYKFISNIFLYFNLEKYVLMYILRYRGKKQITEDQHLSYKI